MIDDVLNQQERALQLFHNVLEGDGKETRGARKLLGGLNVRRVAIEKLQKDAAQTYGAVRFS